MSRNDSLTRSEEAQYNLEQSRYEWHLSSIQRFRLFFSGLVFAILSFSLKVDFSCLAVFTKIIYSFSWMSLLICGLLSIRECGGFQSQFSVNSFDGLSKSFKNVMWYSFIISLTLLVVAKWLE